MTDLPPMESAPLDIPEAALDQVLALLDLAGSAAQEGLDEVLTPEQRIQGSVAAVVQMVFVTALRGAKDGDEAFAITRAMGAGVGAAIASFSQTMPAPLRGLAIDTFVRDAIGGIPAGVEAALSSISRRSRG